MDLHPICIARWSHPICTKSIHHYYLNYYTVYLEYTDELKLTTKNHINDTLMCASIHGNLIIVKWCLKNGADVHYGGDGAVSWAITNGYLEIGWLLLAAGAIIHDKCGNLSWAAVNGHLEIVRFLLAAGADIHAYNDYALKLIASSGNIEMARFLLENYKFSIIVVRTAIEKARSNDNVEIAKLLALYL